MLKPRQIAEALPDVTARKAGDWLRGDRSPSVVDLARILEAFPDLDARAFVTRLGWRRWSRHHPEDSEEIEREYLQRLADGERDVEVGDG